MTLFSFKWDNVWIGEGVDEEVYMNLLIDQTHTAKKVRYIVPMSVINQMCKHDTTPGNESWWTLNLSLEIVLT
jgi:hypothetical protein